MNVHFDRALHLNALGEAVGPAAEPIVRNEQDFRRMISLERKRSERSRKSFLLMLLRMDQTSSRQRNNTILRNTLSAISRYIRETDVVGWYEDHSTVGIMFTEMSVENCSETVSALTARVSEALRSHLTLEQFDQMTLCCHVYPDDWDETDAQPPSNPTLYPDLTARHEARKSMRIMKRAIDIVGSVSALVLLSPVFVMVAIAVKATSKGPVFFRQKRLGQFGASFSMLKFRSMYAGSTSNPHKEYVQQLIAGVAAKNPSNGDGPKVYKLTKDSRITRVGAVLRKTSLDELPQLLNVLKGEMSLVGPRPPIDYEIETYELWHRRRLMETKPGITGLWQVAGRNLIPFDEMVRLDLRYAQSWSPWLDLKILLRTPKAVIEGAH